jgi:hypothetical protein
VLRLLRRGYSTLLLDIDTVLFSNPYPIILGEGGRGTSPLASIALIGHADWIGGFAQVNGGTWFLNARATQRGGPVEQIYIDFERRIFDVLDSNVTWRDVKGHPASALLDDQAVLSDVLLSTHAGRELTWHSPWFPWHERTSPRQWTAGLPPLWTEEPLQGGGVRDEVRPAWAALRSVLLRRPGSNEEREERVALAPPWLFGAESDAQISRRRALPTENGAESDAQISRRRPLPTENGAVRARARVRPLTRSAANTEARLWGAAPSTTALAHLVCTAYPGGGGRIAAMALWGRWLTADIEHQLGPLAACIATAHDRGGGRRMLRRCLRARVAELLGDQPTARPTAPSRTGVVAKERLDLAAEALHSTIVAVGQSGFDAHRWLRECGASCAFFDCPHRCEDWVHGRGKGGTPSWLPLAPPPSPSAALPGAGFPSVPDIQARIRALQATHPQALISMRYPLRVSGRREYQLYVRALFGAAAITGRRPLLPLASCNVEGEWAETSRCVYAVHYDANTTHHDSGGGGSMGSGLQRLCVMRPPSDCHGRIALPQEAVGVPAKDVAVAMAPRLDGSGAEGRLLQLSNALGADAATRGAKLLLMDMSDIRTPEALMALHIGRRKWLCPLDVKACVQTCLADTEWSERERMSLFGVGRAGRWPPPSV